MATLKTANSLQAFLSSVIDESVRSALYHKTLQEKEKQQAAAPSGGTENTATASGGATDIFAGSEPSDSGEEQPVPSKTGEDADDDTMKQGDIEPDDVIEKLNSIRSDKSFKDSAVSGAMDEYVGSLSKAEKTALFTFLKGIAQIVTGEVPAQQAVEPEDNPADVKMEKGTSTKTKQIKPNVIKASVPKAKSKPGVEDTSGPAPITPVKK